MEKYEPRFTTLSRKGQIVIPQALRKHLRLMPNTRFLVYGEGDTLLLRRLELPDIRRDWKNIKASVGKRLEKYGKLGDEEIEATVRKYRHGKKKSS